MKKDKTNSKIVLIFLILFFCLFCVLIFLTNKLEGQKEEELRQIALTKQPQNVEEVMKKYNIKQSNKERNKYYVSFEKDLYEENGQSNEEYFENIVNDMTPFFDKEPFYIIDENKSIEIYSGYDYNKEDRVVTINDIEDFYANTDGDSYVNVETSAIVDGSNIATNNRVLDLSRAFGGYFSSLEEELGEGKDAPYGYKSFQNDQIKIKLSPTGAVRNVIFGNGYEGDITYRLNTSMTLREIEETEPNFDFGGAQYGYIGYRTTNYYIFFYDDEVSVYTYAYRENDAFEALLEQYLETKDLAYFVKRLQKKYKAYDEYDFKFDAENNNLYMNYCTRGIEIDIKGNDPKGITLYSNYYFTDYTKSLVKNGIVSFDGKTDMVEKKELERRENN